MVFPQPLLDALRAAPGTPAFEHGGRTVSRGELLELIGRLADGMRAAGLGPGRAIAVRTAVTPEAFAAHMAAHVLGCRVVGIRPGYPPGQLAHVLGMGIDAVLVDPTTATPELLAAARTTLSLGPGATDLLTHPTDARPTDGRPYDARPTDGRPYDARSSDDRPGGGDRPLAVTARPGDVAALTFTSGSTGRPKGCAFTYAALSAHWAWQPRVWSPVAAAFARGFERYLLFGTLASMVVMEFLAPCLLGGGTAVIPEDDGRPLFPYAIERYRITGSIITVPRLTQMLNLLKKEPADVGSLRALMVSGSPIGPSRLAAAAERLGPVVYQGYGATEAGNVAMLTPEQIAAGVLDSVGRPHPMVELSVRDEEGAELTPGRTGEIHVRSPYVMRGYWDDDAETRDTLRDGWLRTRDLGHVDEDGYLHLAGRSRDVIMVNAMVVYAGPIERVLAAHPDVAEAYVAGALDEGTGEAVHAFVVPEEGRSPDREALAALVLAELGADSVPQTITVVPGVPVATSGKPDKRALLDLPRSAL
jgi:acyl-CoA synthetase (AMP-forming)/AMP-acid ligase II